MTLLDNVWKHVHVGEKEPTILLTLRLQRSKLHRKPELVGMFPFITGTDAIKWSGLIAGDALITFGAKADTAMLASSLSQNFAFPKNLTMNKERFTCEDIECVLRRGIEGSLASCESVIDADVLLAELVIWPSRLVRMESNISRNSFEFEYSLKKEKQAA